MKTVRRKPPLPPKPPRKPVKPQPRKTLAHLGLPNVDDVDFPGGGSAFSLPASVAARIAEKERRKRRKE